MEFKEALKRGLYDYELARNWYRSVCSPDNGGPGMHRDLVFNYIRTSALLIAPFTPHFSEHVYKNVCGEQGSIQNAPFPRSSGKIDTAVLAQLEYMRGVVDTFRSAEALMSKKKGKKGVSTGAFDPALPKGARCFVATHFPEWQTTCVEVVKSVYQDGKFDEDALKKKMVEGGFMKDKKAMPFVQTIKVGPPVEVWFVDLRC
jgi:leucyl-tRNA synthetase